MSVRDCADEFQLARHDLLGRLHVDAEQPQEWDEKSGFLKPGSLVALVRELWPADGIGPIVQTALRAATSAPRRTCPKWLTWQIGRRVFYTRWRSHWWIAWKTALQFQTV